MTMADRIAVMSEGRVMQFDTPDRIFFHPANRFVAQFVGSPGVNILPAVLETRDGKSCLVAGPLVVPLGASAPESLRSARLEIGIRPHFLRLEAMPGGLSAKGRVVALEPFGTETNVHATLGDHTVVLVADPKKAPRAGEEITVFCSPSDLYVFDAGDGRLLSHGL